MLTLQSQNFDPKDHFCPHNQHVQGGADLPLPRCTCSDSILVNAAAAQPACTEQVSDLLAH